MKPHLVMQALTQAEGYLELGLPEWALRSVDRCDTFGPFAYEAHYLKGEALRALERYDQALIPLREAVRLRPDAVAPRVALGWCLKRTRHLDQAIQVLEELLDHEKPEAIVPFNLACYWCVAGEKTKALNLLERALRIDPTYARHAASDMDLADLRDEPAFHRLVDGASHGPASKGTAGPGTHGSDADPTRAADPEVRP